jgi:hypothetical protein
MSRAEIDRVHVLRDSLAERIGIREAVQLMRVTRRPFFQLLEAYPAGGPAALVSKKRGKPSNRAYPAVVRTEVLALIKANYAELSHHWRSGTGCIWAWRPDRRRGTTFQGRRHAAIMSNSTCTRS